MLSAPLSITLPVPFTIFIVNEYPSSSASFCFSTFRIGSCPFFQITFNAVSYTHLPLLPDGSAAGAEVGVGIGVGSFKPVPVPSPFPPLLILTSDIS